MNMRLLFILRVLDRNTRESYLRYQGSSEALIRGSSKSDPIVRNAMTRIEDRGRRRWAACRVLFTTGKEVALRGSPTE